MKKLIVFLAMMSSLSTIVAQSGIAAGGPMIARIAEIEVHAGFLDAYLDEARKVGVASVKTEPGVICIWPMQVQRDRNQIRILEIYADSAAYDAHIRSAHFQRYKQGTLHMIKSLALVDADPLAPAMLGRLFRKATELRVPAERIITVEEHFIIPDINRRVMAYLTARNGGVPPVGPAQRDLMKIVLPTTEDIEDVAERRLRFMDEAGIDMQILSYGAGGPQNIVDTALAVELCRAANDSLARMVERYPDRFAGLAQLPVTDPTAAADELTRAVQQLGLKGAMLSGTFNGRFFDSPEFAPIFERAEALGVPLFMHPATIAPDVARYYYHSPQWSGVAAAMFASAGYGWHADSGIGVIRMILSGLFDRYPRLQIVSGHWGELVPFYLNRLDDQQQKTVSLKRPISSYFRTNIYITPSGFFNEEQLKYAIATVGADRIVYSGDYPFLIDRTTRRFLDDAAITPDERQMIGWRNAVKLFGLDAAGR